jgi:hypothetical protein
MEKAPQCGAFFGLRPSRRVGASSDSIPQQCAQTVWLPAFFILNKSGANLFVVTAFSPIKRHTGLENAGYVDVRHMSQTKIVIGPMK